MEKDLLVIGGGINGVGIAADAAGRGLSVTLCEMGDLSSGTSSASSKLIHGGLRYLANGDFGLVHESLAERKILQRLAPHLVKPQAFVMPHCPWLRPFWVLRAGLFVYDWLSIDSRMPKSRVLRSPELVGLGLQPNFTRALQYYDCTEDDSRLVMHVALLAKQHGAEILPRTKLVKALRKSTGWTVTLLHQRDLRVINVKAIVNASGPWVMQTATDILQIQPKHDLKLVKGSHIIVPKLSALQSAMVLQTEDQRVVFVIPYHNDFTLIGTTEVLLDHIEQPATVSNAEIQYLCATVNKFLQKPINARDIVYKYAGIRALQAAAQNNPSKMTRDYAFDVDVTERHAPVISVFGGKITTYRHLAEKLCDQLKAFFPNLGKPWTTSAYLPGGYFPNEDVAAFTQHIFKTYAPLPRDLLQHYIDTYGTRTVELLMNSHSVSDLGRHFGALLYQREVDYLVQYEWATTAEDILWRRGKQGLWFSQAQVDDLSSYLMGH